MDTAYTTTYLPPLTESHVIASSQNQFGPEASNLGLGFGFGFEQVPCFSSFNSGSSLSASNCTPPVMNSVERFQPQLGQWLDPLQYETSFLKVLGQLSKPNINEGGCGSHSSDNAAAACWNPF
jgi:hypothetical protein